MTSPVPDDIRQLSLPEPSRATEEQIEAARAIVMKLRFKYAPEKIENPVVQKHWINVEAIALNRPQPDEFVDYTGKHTVVIKGVASTSILCYISGICVIIPGNCGVDAIFPLRAVVHQYLMWYNLPAS